MLHSLSLKYKIIFSSLLPLFIMVIVNIVVFTNFNILQKNIEEVNFISDVIEDTISIGKNATDMESSERGFLLAGNKAFLQPYNLMSKKIDKDIDTLANKVSHNQSQVALLRKAQEYLNYWKNNIAEVYINKRLELDNTQSPDVNKVMDELVSKGEGEKYFTLFNDELKKFLVEEKRLSKIRESESNSSISVTNKSIIYGTLISFIIAIMISIILMNSIIQPIKRLKDNALSMSQGNLDIKIEDTNRNDEIGSLAKSFETMNNGIEKILTELKEGINTLTTSINQILATTTQLSSSSAETASSVSETTSTAEEVRQTSQLNFSKAQHVEESTQKSINDSNAGKKALEENTQKLKEIKNSMEEIGKNIVELNEQSRTIGYIVTTVEDIANQSNILSINASIEAVKAGEYGKGFSVVAQELKSLADQSKDGTTKIQNILNDIQNATNKLVMTAEQGGKYVDEGVSHAQKVKDSFNVLNESINMAAKASRQIASTSEQGEAGMKQIVEAMKNIQIASTQNKDAIVQVEEAVQTLNELGNNLKNVVAQYTLEKRV